MKDFFQKIGVLTKEDAHHAAEKTKELLADSPTLADSPILVGKLDENEVSNMVMKLSLELGKLEPVVPFFNLMDQATKLSRITDESAKYLQALDLVGDTPESVIAAINAQPAALQSLMVKSFQEQMNRFGPELDSIQAKETANRETRKSLELQMDELVKQETLCLQQRTAWQDEIDTAHAITRTAGKNLAETYEPIGTRILQILTT